MFTNTLSEKIRFVSNCQSSACYLTAQHNPTTLSSFPAASLLLSTPSHNPVRSHIQFKHSLISQRHRKKKAGVLLRVCVFVCLCVCGLRLKQQRQLSGDKEKDDLHDFCRTRCRLPPSEKQQFWLFQFLVSPKQKRSRCRFIPPYKLHIKYTHHNKTIIKQRVPDLPWLFKLPVSEKVEFKEIHSCCCCRRCCCWLKSCATWFYMGY